jgi:hypothetical protein
VLSAASPPDAPELAPEPPPQAASDRTITPASAAAKTLFFIQFSSLINDEKVLICIKILSLPRSYVNRLSDISLYFLSNCSIITGITAKALCKMLRLVRIIVAKAPAFCYTHIEIISSFYQR